LSVKPPKIQHIFPPKIVQNWWKNLVMKNPPLEGSLSRHAVTSGLTAWEIFPKFLDDLEKFIQELSQMVNGPFFTINIRNIM